jgi:hypothetical protein
MFWLFSHEFFLLGSLQGLRYVDFMAGGNRERLERKYLAARRLQTDSASLPGSGAARFELAEGILMPQSARTRWSILGPFLEVMFRLGDDRTFRLRTRRDASLRPGSVAEAVSVICGYWPRPLGDKRPFYEVSEVVERDTDRRYSTSAAAQFGPVVLIGVILLAAVLLGLVKQATG